MRRIIFLAVAVGFVAAAGIYPGPAHAEPVHAIAMHGTPALAEGFTTFPYVNPDAPKGGRVTLGSPGSFDNLNPMIVRGEPVQGIREFVVESLMARSQDEPFTLYGLIAEKIDVADNRTEVTFHLNPLAKFSDGQPVTAADVLFSFEVLRDKGRPNYRTYYKKVVKTEVLSDHMIRFVFADAEDRELPLILGLMPMLPRHAMSADNIRPDHPHAHRRLRPLPHRLRRSGPRHHLRAQPGLLGARPARQPRPLQLRRDPLRILPRGHDPVRSLQDRQHRPPQRGRSGHMGQGLQFPGRHATDASRARKCRSRFPPA